MWAKQKCGGRARHALILVVILLLLQGVWANLPPSFTADMNLHVVSEDTPVGAAVYTLKASDPEGGPVTFGMSGSDRLRVDPDTGIVTVAKPLDREQNDTLRLVVTVEDEVKGGAENNVVRVPISLIVLDTNDNSPKFLQTPYEAMVGEDAAVGSTVLPGIRLVDEDQVGDNIKVECEPISQGDDVCKAFTIVASQTSARKFSGSLVLNQPLQYSTRNLYQFKLVASDGGQVSSVGVVIRVRDVQNSPPVFSGSLTGIITEDDAIGTRVMSLQAADGDTGAPRPIRYELITNPLDFFTLDAKSGELRTAKPLDREALQSPDGVVKVRVKAYETINGSPIGTKDTETVADVTITIRDVNDEPPSFNKREYRASVPENVPDGTPLPNLDMFVQDTDVGSNSVFSLRLVDASGIFSVEPQVASGSSSVSIRVAHGPLDFENPNQRKFLLQVIAEETLTNPRLSSTATVVVSVTDTNDNSPQFDQEAYTAVVSETANPGTVVTTIVASDRDTGQFGTDGIKYSLFGNGAEKFDVDATSGVMTVAFCDTPGHRNCLDYEERPTYFLSFQATDAGGTGHTTVVPVRVTLADSNDNPPKFSRQQYRAVIDEGAPDFDPPLFVTAEDPDATSRVVYSIVGGDPTGLFTINPDSGRIRVASESGLDISNLKTDYIILTVEANDGEGSHTANIKVSVRDANNNVPVFSKNPYLAAVQENAPEGSVVEQVSASDADTGANAAIVYRIHRGGYDDFAIDGTTGIITVARKLDYDRRKSYDIEIVATDRGIPQQTSTSTLTVSIINNNDKSPYFTPTTQRTQVSEDLQEGTTFYKLTAQDPDVEGEGALVFGVNLPVSAVDSEGRPVEGPQRDALADVFVVDPVTGSVTVARKLNRAVATEVTLAVTVTDMSATPPQVGHGNLVITIVDVNDFPPVFAPPWSTESPVIHVKVAEELPRGSLLTTITASDVDSNIGKNNCEFSDETIVEITVLPQNQHKPKFISPAVPNATVLVQENWSSAVQEVIAVEAEDKDLGANGEVRYHLRVGEENLQDTSEFHLDPITGLLTTKLVLDSRKQSKYELVLVAKDQGSPISYETLRFLTVLVEDVNDNRPEFHKSSVPQAYRFNVIENTAKHTLIGQLLAEDPDAGINAKIFYYLVTGNAHESFYLDKLHGKLYTNAVLDREQQSSYTLVVKATNDPNFTVDPDQEVVYDENDPTLAIITVNIEDENDTPPRFIHEAYYAGVSYEAEVDRFVRMVSAVDEDAGLNGTLSYSIRASNLFRPGESRAVGSIIPSPFNITQDGKLTTASLMSQYRRHRFLLLLHAKEEAPPFRIATCTVNVWVWEREDLVRVVLAQPPEEVVHHQEDIAATLSQVTKGIAVVDEIRYHVNPDIYSYSADMLVHIVNQTEQVMPVHMPASIETVEEEVDARLAGLIALMIVLFIGFISFIVVCCCLRYWVMTPSRSSEHLIKRNIDEDLGLNTTENPLWVDQKLKMYEEQELTMQVMSEFDTTQVNVPPNTSKGPSVTVDAEWTPERRSSIDLSQLDGQSNTYATIQKSHGGTLRSLQLRGLQQGTLKLGEDPGESNDYATLDHLHHPASAQGPRVPGVETPRSPLNQNGDYHELRTSFTGSTFQPPDLANRPLPDEPTIVHPNSRNLAFNAQGEPVLVAELI
nr:LOW QUALITY PROTEIN: cadherin-87A-like [Cherax quadricarinatus]